MVTSLASLFPGLPIMSAYCASKHAVESFTGSLRHEMAGWGIEVSKRHSRRIPTPPPNLVQRIRRACDHVHDTSGSFIFTPIERTLCPMAF
jgi:short-subunit dehydrogenase